MPGFKIRLEVAGTSIDVAGPPVAGAGGTPAGGPLVAFVAGSPGVALGALADVVRGAIGSLVVGTFKEVVIGAFRIGVVVPSSGGIAFVFSAPPRKSLLRLPLFFIAII